MSYSWLATLGAGALYIAASLTPESVAPAGAPLPHHPHDIVHAFAVNPDYPADPRMFLASQGSINLFLLSEDRGAIWSESRRGLRGLLVRQIEFASDWAESGIVYTASLDAGIQISRDGGATWNPTSIRRSVPYMAVAPVGPSGERVLAFAEKSRLFLSNDDGATETPTDLSPDGAISAVAISPSYASDGVLIVGDETGGLHVSRDRGASWDRQAVGKPVRDIRFSPGFADDGRIWIATWGAGVLASHDGGKSFAPTVRGLSDLEVNQIAVGRKPGGFDLFACTREDGAFHSADSGATWKQTPLEVEKTHQTDNHHRIIRVSPNWPEDRTVWCGTFEGLHYSDDGGLRWHEANINPPRIGRLLGISPDFESDGSVFGAGYGMHLMVSEDEGTSWDVRYDGFFAMSCYAIGVSPDFRDDRLLILGASRGFRRSTDVGRTYRATRVPAHPEQFDSGGYTIKDVEFSPGFRNDRRVLAINSRGTLYESTDAGVTWSIVSLVSKWATALELSPGFDEDSVLFAGGIGVFRSSDGGRTFGKPILQGTLIGNGLRVAHDFLDSGEVYALVKGVGFMRSEDRGDTWVESNDGLEGFIPTVIDQAPDGTIVACTGGGGVFVSTDRGRTWTKRAGGGVAEHGICLAISPDFANDGTLFVGTFDGFCRSQDGGWTWELVTRSEVYDELRDPWTKVGAWQSVTTKGAINRTITFSDAAGDVMRLPFEGMGVKLIGVVGPEHGRAEIRIDGELVKEIDCYAPTRRMKSVLFEHEWNQLGQHVIEVRVVGHGSSESRGRRIAIDAAEILLR